MNNILIQKINRLQALRDMGYHQSNIDEAINDLAAIAPSIVNGLIDRGDRNWEHVQKLSEQVCDLEDGLTQANINIHDRDCRLVECRIEIDELIDKLNTADRAMASMGTTIDSLKDKLAFENGINFNNGKVVKVDATVYQTVMDQNRDLKDELRQAQKNSIFLNTRINNQASEIETLNRDNKGLTILNGQQASMIRTLKNDLSICRGELGKLQRVVDDLNQHLFGR